MEGAAKKGTPLKPDAKILLVDDHALFREGVALLLRQNFPGTSIAEAGSCEEALQMIDTGGPYDLILMDLGLPGMSGMDGINAICSQRSGTPVVALSGQDDPDTVLHAINQGAMGFIPKNSPSTTMVGAIDLILMKGVYLPPAVFLRSPHTLAHRSAEHRPSITAGNPSKLVTHAELKLTPRQTDVLYLILQGKSAKAIARELGLSPNTVKLHTTSVLRALNVTTRTEAVIAAAKLGLRFGQQEPAHDTPTA